MKIKTKLQGAGIGGCVLLVVILAVSVSVFNDLSSGFLQIDNNAGKGVSKSQDTDKQLEQVNSALAKLSNKMNLMAEDIAKSNMRVKIVAKKITNLSNDLNDITESIEETYDALEEGETKDSLSYVADDISDMQERMKREALIGLDAAVQEIQVFTKEVAENVLVVKQLGQELDKAKAQSNDVNSLNADIKSLTREFIGSLEKNRNNIAGIILASCLVSLIFAFVIAKKITDPIHKAIEFCFELN